MFEVVQAFLLSYVEILKVFIPLILVFDIAGDLLWK